MLGHFSKDGENIFLGFFRMVHAAISHTKIRFHERLNPKIPKPLRNPPEAIPQNGKTPDGALAQLPPLRPPAPLLLPLHGGAPATRQNSPPPQPLAYGLPPCPPPRLTPSPHPLTPFASAPPLALSLPSPSYPASPTGSAPKRSRTMATDAAAAGPPASKGCPAMKAEFAKHAEYLNALVPCLVSYL